jgi:hypothetical protein
MRWVVCLAFLAACSADEPARGDAGADAGDAAAADAGLDGARDGATADAAGACTASGISGMCTAAAACTGTAESHFCSAGKVCCLPHQADGGFMCDEKAHPLPNEGLREEPGEGGCPAGMLRVTTFCIDRFEASLVKLDGTGWSPFFNPGSTPVRAVSLRGAVPQGYIDEVRAAAACKNAGKRMCTDAEWLRACRGPQSYTYPYGNTRMPGVCNDSRPVHPAVEYFHSTASWIYTMLANPCLDQLPFSVDRTGERADCRSAEGAYDMMGNLHEWTGDPNGTFRGGYYMDTVLNGNGCLYATVKHDVNQIDYSTGFRCCAD